ncbi:hypothetical protein EXIGLDRAFT_719233 [Exidia glandulosa HHB12029]|uniref:Uncharacterized protein n=1 Tax=Exidia glandulosa HHB12029 TaxID=1314781 RepID=A0A165H707_EXIGL|nr:hypothetical protein EXIGLDRAFT_719233 [Exidia glandulosa HHB12029]
MSAVDPNRYAQPLEATMLRGQVASDQDELVRNEACVRQAATTLHDAEQVLLAAQGAAASARAYLEDIKAQGQGIRQRLLRAHGLLHPVRRLPDEILGEVMLTLLHIEATRRLLGLSPTLQASQRVPFTMAAVCKRWRSVALRTPRLWASVAIDLLLTETRALMTSERTDAWLGFLKTHAAYSKGAEIDLQLNLAHSWTIVPVDVWSVIQEFARFARSATLYMPSDPGPHSDRPLSNMSSYWFRNLLELHISAIDKQDAGVLRHFPTMGRHLRLRSLKVDDFWPSWDVFPDLPMCTSASFRPISALVTLDDLALLAVKLPVVEDLDLGLVHADLQATSESGRSTVEFANVIKFCFTADQDATLFMVRLPKLQDVSVWLEVDEGIAQESALIHHLKHSFNVPTLRRLSILPHSFGMNADVARALSGTTALEELSLKLPQDEAVSPSFLAELSNPTTSGNWLCPKLRLLEVESFMTDAIHRAAVESAFLELLSARRASTRDTNQNLPSLKTTTALREARLRWYDDMGHQVKDAASAELEAQVCSILQ